MHREHVQFTANSDEILSTQHVCLLPDLQFVNFATFYSRALLFVLLVFSFIQPSVLPVRWLAHSQREAAADRLAVWLLSHAITVSVWFCVVLRPH